MRHAVEARVNTCIDERLQPLRQVPNLCFQCLQFGLELCFQRVDFFIDALLAFFYLAAERPQPLVHTADVAADDALAQVGIEFVLPGCRCVLRFGSFRRRYRCLHSAVLPRGAGDALALFMLAAGVV